MKIKDAKKPCKMGTWALWVGRAPWPRPEAPWQSGLVPNPSLIAGALHGLRVEGPFQPGVHEAPSLPPYTCATNACSPLALFSYFLLEIW